MKLKNFSDIEFTEKLDGVASVNIITGVLYVNPKFWNKYGDKTKKFILAHELAHLNGFRDEKQADNFAFWRCLGFGMQAIECFDAIKKALPFDTQEQRERAEAILRKCFEAQTSDSEQLTTFKKSINHETDNTDIIFNSRGRFWLKISGIIGKAVGTVLSVIPVTSAFGAGVLVLSEAQTKYAEKIENDVINGQADEWSKEYLNQVYEAQAHNYPLQVKQANLSRASLLAKAETKALQAVADSYNDVEQRNWHQQKNDNIYIVEQQQYKRKLIAYITGLILCFVAFVIVQKKL